MHLLASDTRVITLHNVRSVQRFTILDLPTGLVVDLSFESFLGDGGGRLALRRAHRLLIRHRFVILGRPFRLLLRLLAPLPLHPPVLEPDFHLRQTSSCKTKSKLFSSGESYGRAKHNSKQTDRSHILGLWWLTAGNVMRIYHVYGFSL